MFKLLGQIGFFFSFIFLFFLSLPPFFSSPLPAAPIKVVGQESNWKESL